MTSNKQRLGLGRQSFVIILCLQQTFLAKFSVLNFQVLMTNVCMKIQVRTYKILDNYLYLHFTLTWAPQAPLLSPQRGKSTLKYELQKHTTTKKQSNLKTILYFPPKINTLREKVKKSDKDLSIKCICKGVFYFCESVCV